MPKLTIDGKEIEVEAGTNLIEAARRLGVEVPHYCYHPALSIAGQCRLCMVDIEKAPRPTIACNTVATDGMVVLTDTDAGAETRQSMMEFHLINHPLDCPVCDQAGECWLQIYYMKHGLYDPRMTDEKVHKPKAVPLGPHVMLDAERCILCSRCVRFCDEITGTGELGIFNRGDHSEIGLFPGRDLDNNYSANVVDICPVGRAHRPRLPLPGARVVPRHRQVDLHGLRARLQHRRPRQPPPPASRRGPAGGAAQAALQRRRQHVVDLRRGPLRLRLRRRAEPARRRPPARTRRLADGDAGTTRSRPSPTRCAATRPSEIAVLASPQMANEDLMALRRLLEARGIRQVAFAVPPARRRPTSDDFLLRADRNPNRAAPSCSVSAAMRRRCSRPPRGPAPALPVDLRSRPAGVRLAGRGRAAEALGRVETVIFTGTNANATSAAPTGCCRRRRGSSARAPSRTSRGACSASARRSSRSARR